jgi:hypothetical protein
LNALPSGAAQFAWRAASGVGARGAGDGLGAALATMGTDTDDRMKSVVTEIAAIEFLLSNFVKTLSTVNNN